MILDDLVWFNSFESLRVSHLFDVMKLGSLVVNAMMTLS